MSQAHLTLVFGSVASLLFITSHLPMLSRAARTKDLHSYSFAYLLLSNLGNLCYWVYVATLPLGPIWVMHAFYTAAAALMLAWYVQHTGIRFGGWGKRERTSSCLEPSTNHKGKEI